MAKRTKKPRVKKSEHEQLLEDLALYKSLLERVLVATAISHAKELRPLGGGFGAWSPSCLKQAILLSHLWPNDEPDTYRETAYSIYEMERRIPQALLDELLANPPTEPAQKPADNDHSRPWVCFLAHQYPEVESTEHDDLITDEERYRAYHVCPVFRATRAKALLGGRELARTLSRKHNARFTTDCHGRLIVPDDLAAPTHWKERGFGKHKDKQYAIGDIDDQGFQLRTLKLTGRRPEDRQRHRWNGETNSGHFTVEQRSGTRHEGRTVLDVCTLQSTWQWVEPADGDRVPLSRVPVGGIIQLIKRGKPGNLCRRTWHNGEWEPDLPFETTVVYRCASALPTTILETLGAKVTKARREPERVAKLTTAPAFDKDSLFAQHG